MKSKKLQKFKIFDRFLEKQSFSKKAQLEPMQKAGGSILVIIVLIILIVFAVRFIREPGEEGFGARIDSLKDSNCKQSGQLKELNGISFEDIDGDSRPDLTCDICVPGDNDIDTDGDGVPDACDAAPKDPNIGFCKINDKECPGSVCCKVGGKCGPGDKGTIINIGSKDNPVYQCKINS